MIILDDYRFKLDDLSKQIKELGEAMKLESLKERLAEIEKISGAADFWSGDMEASQKLLVEQKQIKEKVSAYAALESLCEDGYTLIELAGEEQTDEFDAEIVETVGNVEKRAGKADSLRPGGYQRSRLRRHQIQSDHPPQAHHPGAGRRGHGHPGRGGAGQGRGGGQALHPRPDRDPRQGAPRRHCGPA